MDKFASILLSVFSNDFNDVRFYKLSPKPMAAPDDGCRAAGREPDDRDPENVFNEWLVRGFVDPG